MKHKYLSNTAQALFLAAIFIAVSGCKSNAPASAVESQSTASSAGDTAVSTPARGPALFTATPLTDFRPGELYLGKFAGMLYDGSNAPPMEHDADGRAAAAKIVPIDGKIVVVGMGMSNWTQELCAGRWPQCRPQSFIGQLIADSRVNHANLVVVDCALNAQSAGAWLDDRNSNYSQCRQRLAEMGLTEKQVQVVLWLNANPKPPSSLSPATVCSPSSSVEACVYTSQLGQIVRYVAKRYPNTKQFFVHARTYGGYATMPLSPEPYAYEYGFATKWLVAAQINQLRTGKTDAVAGDLGYGVAPWLAWGPYFWASGGTPRSDGLTWDADDFIPIDRTHPSLRGVEKVAAQMMQWYLASPYTGWFRAAGR